IARLLGTARDLGPHGRDPAYGFGAVDPLAALTRPVPQVAENPLVMAAAATTVDAHLAGTQRGGAGTDPADGAIGGRPDGRLPLVLLVAAALAGLLLWAVRPRPRRARPR
ncbi:MAG TPA: type VII secretion-associated serine protease mycosin, partial [Pilimelia sp.]|nr:type VII secretion-associated serine protease mycosin [Pilimelia sp.]